MASKPRSSLSTSPPHFLPPPIITITNTNNNHNDHQNRQHYQQQQRRHQQSVHQRNINQAPAPKRKQYRQSPSSSSNATNTPTPTPSSPSSISTASTSTPLPSHLTNVTDAPEPLIQVDFRTPSPSTATPTKLNATSSSLQNLTPTSQLSFNSQSPLNVSPSPRSLSTSPLHSGSQSPSPASFEDKGRIGNPLSPLNFNNISPLNITISPLNTPLISPLPLSTYDPKAPLIVDISPLNIEPPNSIQGSAHNLEQTSYSSYRHKHDRSLTCSQELSDKYSSLKRREITPHSILSETMNLDPPMSRYRGDSGGSGGTRTSALSSRNTTNLSGTMTNRPSSRSSSRSSIVQNSLQSNRSGNVPTGISPRKLSRTLSGSGHMSKNMNSANNIPSLSGNIPGGINLGGGGGTLSNTSTGGSGDEDLDLDELLRMNVPHNRRNVDRSIEELCGGRERDSSYGGSNRSVMMDQGISKGSKMEPISTITGRLTPMSDSNSNPYKACGIESTKMSLGMTANAMSSSKKSLNQGIYSSNAGSTAHNPYASNSNISNSYASNPNIAHHNPYASNTSINMDNNPYSSTNNSTTNIATRGGRNGGRRGILQRSDTAPEELVLERKFERKMESDWRRKRSFIRGGSAERPSSVTHSSRATAANSFNSSHTEYAGEYTLQLKTFNNSCYVNYCIISKILFIEKFFSSSFHFWI